MSMRKLTIPLAVALAFAVLAPVLYCLYVSATAWSVLASAVSISASFILWRVARRFEASVPVPAPPRESNGADAGESKRLVVELACARAQAQETEKKLKKTISDLEEFALLAIRRELKMQELRERFVQLKRDHEINRDFPD